VIESIKEMGGVVMWKRRGSYRVLFGKHEGKRLLGRPRHGGIMILKCILKKSNREHGLV
jgi:hypothetical protein